MLNDAVQLMTLDRMLKTGEYTAPEPFDDLELGMSWCRKVYRDHREDLPEDRLELIRRYMTDALELQAKIRSGG